VKNEVEIQLNVIMLKSKIAQDALNDLRAYVKGLKLLDYTVETKIFHGGCHGCTQQILTNGTRVCRGCGYYNIGSGLPKLNNSIKLCFQCKKEYWSLDGSEICSDCKDRDTPKTTSKTERAVPADTHFSNIANQLAEIYNSTKTRAHKDHEVLKAIKQAYLEAIECAAIDDLMRPFI
jgi:hypothetical protein